MKLLKFKATLHVLIVAILWTLTTGKMMDMMGGGSSGGSGGMEVMVVGSDGKMMR